MLKTIDRYILKELTFPFFVAVGGFIIFITLNLILQLSDFMIDRSISLLVMVKLLFYKLPELLVLSLPVAVLFSVFLALGRLVHDREIVAMQSAGFSCKRIVVPILIIGLSVGFFDLFLNDRVAPWGNHQYQMLIRQIIYRGEAPSIRDNTFFKGAENRFFYVSHYDSQKKIMENILIYDKTEGFELEELSGTYPKVITAKKAVWRGTTWHLQDGVIHKYDDNGDLVYKAQFETMKIEIGRDLQNLLTQERTPQGMSLSELGEKINTMRQSGLNYDSLVVEYHSKISIPFTAFIFALFGAPLSLMFGKRSRGVGIVIALLLVGTFQGILLWSQTLGRRGIINPVLSAWIPNLIFGLVGIVLFLMMDKVHIDNIWQRIKRTITLVVIFLILSIGFSNYACAEEKSEFIPPIDLQADSITISQNEREVEGAGHVNITYGQNLIQADRITMSEVKKEVWYIKAEGNVSFKNEDFTTQADRMESILELKEDGNLTSKEITLSDFTADLRKKTKTSEFKVTGQQAKFAIDEQIRRVEIRGGASFQLENVHISADRIIIGKDENGQKEAKNNQVKEADLWKLTAAGNVLLKERERTTRAGQLTTHFRWLKDQEIKILAYELANFEGKSSFINSNQQEQTIRYQGEKARLSYDKKGGLELIDVGIGDFTTCIDCASCIEKEAYSMKANRVLIYSDYLLVAFDITTRIFGLPIFWYPMYLAPLQETRESPLFPEFGRSETRGWFANWKFPFFLTDERRTYGYLLVDYFNRFNELGTGVELHYTVGEHAGKIHAYRLAGRRGEYLDLYATYGLPITEHINLNLRADLRAGLYEELTNRKLQSYLELIGSYDQWSWNFKLSRAHHTEDPESEEENYQILERVPEIMVKKNPTSDNLFRYSYGINWGKYREKDFTRPDFLTASRFYGWLDLDLKQISLGEDLIKFNLPSMIRFSLYGKDRPRYVLGTFPTLTLNPLQNLTVRADYKFQASVGDTPFEFDKLTKKNKTLLNLVANGDWLRVDLHSGFDFKEEQFDPVKLSLSTKLLFNNLITAFQYDLNEGRLIEVGITNSINLGNFALQANTGYSFADQKFEDLVIKSKIGKAFDIGLIYDLNRGYLTKTNMEIGFNMGEDWSISLNGEYDFAHREWDKFQYGLVRKFCNCWQVGIFADMDRIWLTAEISAFPTAKVKYSPTDERLSFGE